MFLEIIGKEIIIESTKKVLGILTDLEDHEDPYVNRTIEELDINNKISIIKSLINSRSFSRIENNTKDTQNTNNINHINNINFKMSTINLCIKNLNKIIEKISVELENIKKLVPIHKLKWFHSWREPEYYKNLDELKKYNRIMDGRLKLFLDILKTIR